MIAHNKTFVTHQMLLSKISTYDSLARAVHQEDMYNLLYDNRESFSRIYIPQFTHSRYQNEIKLEMEFVWGVQMCITTPQSYYKIIYEDIVLSDKKNGFKDLTYHNFIVMENNYLAYVDLESYGYWTIAQRRSEFLKGICRFPEEHLPRSKQVNF